MRARIIRATRYNDAMPESAQSEPQTAPPRLCADTAVAVIGLGYVGLPLAVAFGRVFDTRGFDVNERRVDELKRGVDVSGELAAKALAGARRLRFTACADDLRGADVFLVAVPTPVDERKRPDLRALREACRLVGGLIRPGAVVVVESTVFPGATEEVCVPLLEATSGLRCDRGFFVGYSPERINPGDPRHGFADVVKVTAGSTPAAAEFVDALYARVVPAGTHRAPDIRTAEAAKAIENVQRDLNIALVNECAMIFDRLGLDTEAVLRAAGTKWNFLPFQPGLVGGHCIGVDPYYLASKAQEVDCEPELVLAGRRVNDRMAAYVAERVLRLMIGAGIDCAGARVLVLGLAYKENCADVRNTKVADLLAELRARCKRVDVFDPCVSAADGARHGLIDAPPEGAYDAVVLAVAHDCFRQLGAARIRAFGKPTSVAGGAPRRASVLFDVKRLLPAAAVDGRL